MIISAPDCFNLVPPLMIQFHLILVGLVSDLTLSPGYIFDCQNLLAYIIAISFCFSFRLQSCYSKTNIWFFCLILIQIPGCQVNNSHLQQLISSMPDNLDPDLFQLPSANDFNDMPVLILNLNLTISNYLLLTFRISTTQILPSFLFIPVSVWQ